MAQQTHEQRASALLEATRNVLALVQAGEWDELAEREAQRGELVTSLFADPVPVEAAEAVAGCIQQVLALQAQLMPLLQARRDELGAEMREAKAGHAAALAYFRFAE